MASRINSHLRGDSWKFRTAVPSRGIVGRCAPQRRIGGLLSDAAASALSVRAARRLDPAIRFPCVTVTRYGGRYPARWLAELTMPSCGDSIGRTLRPERPVVHRLGIDNATVCGLALPWFVRDSGWPVREKQPSMGCLGTRKAMTCGGPLYRCAKCGNVGCDCGRGGECMNPERIVGLSAGVPVCDCEREGECTNLGFKAGRCCKCGGARHEALQ